MKLLIRKDAAAYLTEKSGVTFKPEGLAALATKGTGPDYSFLNGRAVYEVDALDAWLAAQLAAKRPATKRSPRVTYPAAA